MKSTAKKHRPQNFPLLRGLVVWVDRERRACTLLGMRRACRQKGHFLGDKRRRCAAERTAYLILIGQQECRGSNGAGAEHLLAIDRKTGHSALFWLISRVDLGHTCFGTCLGYF